MNRRNFLKLTGIGTISSIFTPNLNINDKDFENTINQFPKLYIRGNIGIQKIRSRTTFYKIYCSTLENDWINKCEKELSYKYPDWGIDWMPPGELLRFPVSEDSQIKVVVRNYYITDILYFKPKWCKNTKCFMDLILS